MKKLLLTSAALIAAGAISTTASAEAFNGPYVGAQVGWNHDAVDSTRSSVGKITLDTDKDSFIGGVYAGYDYKIMPRVVIGAEAGFDLGASDAFARTTATSRAGIDPKWSIDLTARAGYLVQDNTLLYVRGGYSNVRVGVDRVDGIVKQTDEDHRDAWVVGGGVEQAITPNVSARLEYRYSDLSEGHGSWSRDQILLGASYRF